MAYISNQGVELYYQDQGNKNAKTTLLLSHGYAASSAMWKNQIEFLADQYRIISWDMRGHGRSQSPDDPSLYSAELTLQDITCILDACDVEKAVVGGHSLGGYMSFLFNIHYGQRVKGLMFFNTGPGFRNDKARDEWNQYALSQGKRFEKNGLDALRGKIEAELGHHTSARGLINAAQGMLTQKDSSAIDSLPDIKVPALVICGEQDKGFLNATAYMDEKIPQAQTVIIKDARHAANLDQPDAFNKAMADFLLSIK